MGVETIIILCGAGVAALAILMLKLGKRLAIGLLVLGVLAVVGAVALSMLTQASANRETAIAAQQAAQAAQTAAAGQAMTGAATSITLFLVILLLILVLAVAGTAFAWRWWQKRRKQEQYLEMVRQAQLYALLNGRRAPARRQIPPHPAQAGGPVIVLPGQPYPQYPPTSGISLDDLARALQAVQGQAAPEPLDPLAGLLPPDEWEVLE